MEFLVFLIYGVVVSEWIWGGRAKNNSSSSYSRQGYKHFKIVGVIYLIIGITGLLMFNYFLRDKGIIPIWSFWVGFVGFAIILIIGVINIMKMFMTNQP